uniref:DUF2383 domain-containing protein n=1 Tax=Ningiella ruwaisensis TaxID=2364274 RepID=UPI0010A01647|nr:DUF2383 domain-containing protein [Ningiella ruwaisensis]
MSRVSKVLYNLVTVDYDAIEAYEQAIKRLDSSRHQNQLKEFKQDHERHIENLSALLSEYDKKAPTGPDLKALCTEGKVMFADLIGDKAILRAMNINEKAAKKAYDKALDTDDMPSSVKQTIFSNLLDEERHQAWIEKQIAEM